MSDPRASASTSSPTTPPREKFTVYCYSDVDRPDEVTHRLRSYVPHWRDTAHLSHDQLAALIREDRIDILVEITGHMGRNRLPVFARKPAPLQITHSLAYPHSTGLRNIDVRITDPSCPRCVTRCVNRWRVRPCATNPPPSPGCKPLTKPSG